MRLKAWTVAFVLGLFGTTANADTTNKADTSATLTTAQGVQVLFVNGVSADDLSEPFGLVDGSNQVVVKVNKAIGRGDKRTQVYSAPYILGFSSGAGELYIDAPSFREKRQADKLFEQDKMDWKVSFNDKSIDYSQYKMPGEKGAFPYSNLDEQLAEYNEANGVFFANGKRVELSELQAATAVTATSKSVQRVKSPVTKAKIAYLEMTDEERQAFMKWVAQQ
ncbi:DUF2057 domain-containing protein [Vibrio harveyi]|uniref:DUF2057 domain-containing protein n=1 Tax=Vibrio harveyi TaxID=669 RepID=UPI0006819A50|nr:DUF2057 domain-containing protein [Vibrio harveyi]KNY43341.1 hypothetical protein AKG93_10700 [Vibrio harveyi]PNM40917.1 DUF2057 domain-containing protein [Vibrio harveyi]HDM8060546.1 DUF2057 domain-containing protein [Vibrio harveyi]HDM8196639.1 DUF2057 domain-containing protein [Vibrio harveyi]